MRKNVRLLAGLVALVAVAIYGYDNLDNSGRDASSVTAADAGAYRAAADRIVAAYEARQSDMWIEAGGRVQRVLTDDSDGSRHQRFIVMLPNDHTVLIAHNIDLAQRVPLKAGDNVDFYGEYEWNEQGGVVHWTHRDPRDRASGGWIRHAGTTYR